MEVKLVNSEQKRWYLSPELPTLKVLRLPLPYPGCGEGYYLLMSAGKEAGHHARLVQVSMRHISVW